MATTKAFVLILLLAALPASAQQRDSDSIYYDHACYLNGMRYYSSISVAKYENMRRWSPLDDTAPPVSPKRALELAGNRLALVQIPAEHHWTVGRISLEPLSGGVDGKWMYVVSFVYSYDGGSSGPERTLEFVVTMDNELIDPIVTVEKLSP